MSQAMVLVLPRQVNSQVDSVGFILFFFDHSEKSSGCTSAKLLFIAKPGTPCAWFIISKSFLSINFHAFRYLQTTIRKLFPKLKCHYR